MNMVCPIIKWCYCRQLLQQLDRARRRISVVLVHISKPPTRANGDTHKWNNHLGMTRGLRQKQHQLTEPLCHRNSSVPRSSLRYATAVSRSPSIRTNQLFLLFGTHLWVFKAEIFTKYLYSNQVTGDGKRRARYTHIRDRTWKGNNSAQT